MSATFERLLDLVERHVSEIHARSVVRRAFEACGVVERDPNPRELPRVISRIERSLRLFLDVGKQEALHQQLQVLLPESATSAEASVIDIADEGDIVLARSKARELCVELGAERVATQKAATIVSELARNIVSYTPGGFLELRPSRHPLRLGIRAVDSGTGITNLEEILGGRYRSKTGLGMGLCGTKRLAASFDIKSDSAGTTVEVWVKL